MTHALFRLIVVFILSQTAGAAIVERVIDGDTIEILLDGRKETVRYIGIDAPESVHPRRGMEPFGKAASDFNRSLVGAEKFVWSSTLNRGTATDACWPMSISILSL